MAEQPQETAPRQPDSGIDYRQAYEQAQAQLIAYARDLALAYAAQKRMAQYLPGDLRDRITAGSHSTAGERRYVTVLCVDIVDSTKLASRLEAEDVFGLMNASFRRLVSHIFKHGGMIDKFLGDGIMAVFGASEVRQDDAFRAVQTALDMDREIREFSQEMLPSLGVPLQLHIGINCGLVIAGSVGVDEQLAYTVMGTPVNVAFRLQDLAEPGNILVGESIYQKTKDLFDYRYLGEFELKGIEGPVNVYNVQPKKPARSTEPLAGEFRLAWVGREAEMETLSQAFLDLQQGTGGTIVIAGEPGMGKTRLLRRWLTSLIGERLTVWTGKCQPDKQYTSYGLWRGMMERVLPIAPGDKVLFEVNNSAVWVNWRANVPPVSLILTQVYNQPNLLPPNEMRTLVFQALRDQLITWAQRGPMILVIDDWQWADGISQQMLLSLIPLAEHYPILFCLAGRPQGTTEDWLTPIKQQAGERFREINLNPLSREETLEALQSAVRPKSLQSEGQNLLVERTGGNPLALELALHILVTDGVLKLKGNHCHMAEPHRLAQVNLPADLNGITHVQLDRLPNFLRELADYAAVIGPVVPIRLLRAVVDRERRTKDLARDMQRMTDYGIVAPMAMDDDTYVFQSHLTREAIYAALPPNRLYVLHRAVAEELVNLNSSGRNIDVELIAYHFLKAGGPATAIPYLIQAAKHSQRHAANDLSITYHLAALEAINSAPHYKTEGLGLEISLANTCLQARQYSEAIEHYEAALALCRQQKKQVEIHQSIGRTYAEQGNLTRAWEQLEVALELLATANIPAHSLTRGRVYADCAQTQWRIGNETQANVWAREALAILEGTQERASLTASYQTLSHVYAKLGQHSLAAHYAAKATAAFQPPEPDLSE